MEWLRKRINSHERGAALLIVLAFVVLLTGVSVAYLSRTTSDRQVAHGSFNQSRADQLAASAMDNIIGDLRQEILRGSASPAPSFGSGNNVYYVYTPTSTANMVPQRSGNLAAAPNLIRRSVSPDNIVSPGLPSFASGVNSAPVDPANPKRGDIAKARWNKHYLVPKANTADDGTDPIASFTAPDWVFVTSDTNNQTAGRKVITSPDQTVIGRYSYAIYDEGALVDMNVAGYPTNTTVTQSGRKGSLAYADLTALGNYPIHNGEVGSAYQVDKLVGWRNYGTTQPTNTFPNSNFAANFQTDATRAAAYFTSIVNNTSGFLSTSGTTWDVYNNGRCLRTDQSFVQRQQLIAFRGSMGFSSNALQYLSTFSRETNSPSFSPSTPVGSTIDYAALASTATAINPNFLLRRVTSSFTRFDGSSAVVGEPLVKTRFPLSRLAWITYKGPSATLPTTDPVYLALINAGVSATTISAGTAANIKACFGLTFPTGGPAGSPWTYTNPNGTGAANRILRLDEVVAVGREPDFFELLQAGILSGSLGQDTGGPGGTHGVTGGNVFPDVHMNSTMQHLLTVGACIIDQADPDSIPTRIQFTGANGNTWTAYGVENLPYITQLYPIAGTSPNDSTKWETCLLFQLWNPHQNPAAVSVNVRLRIDGGIGIFTSGNGQTWNTGTTANIYSSASVTLTSGSFSTPTALATDYVNRNTISTGNAAGGTFVFLPSPAVPTPTP
jgi:hypothetical protein